MAFPHISGTLIVVLGIGVASPVWAQMVQTPPGSVRGLFGGGRSQDPNRTASRWTVRFDGGVGRDTVPVDLTPEPATESSLSEFAAGASMMTRYWRGVTGRFIEVSSAGSLNRQSLATEQLRSINGSVRGQTGVGGRFDLAGGFTVSYEPLLVGVPLVETGGSDTAVAPPDDLTPPQGVVEEPWISTMATGTLSRGWTPRQRLDVGFTAMRFEPLEGSAVGTASDEVSFTELWEMNARARLNFNYGYSRTRQTNGAVVTSDGTRVHSTEVGLRLERRLSPSRTVSLDVRGGVSYSLASSTDAAATVESSWLPVGSGAFQVNLSRTWNLSANVRREVTALSGLTPQPFTTDQVSAQVAGNVTPRLSLGVSATYSRGTTVATEPGAYDSTTAAAQVQYGVARCCGVFSSYSYYEHTLQDISTAPAFPPSYGRHSVRVGLSVWLPLYGAF